MTTEQTAARLERHQALQKIKARKLDTRKKIEWGGLIVKAKLNGHSKDIIFGGLLHLVEMIEASPSIVHQFEQRGREIFSVKED